MYIHFYFVPCGRSIVLCVSLSTEFQKVVYSSQVFNYTVTTILIFIHKLSLNAAMKLCSYKYIPSKRSNQWPNLTPETNN